MDMRLIYDPADIIEKRIVFFCDMVVKRQPVSAHGSDSPWEHFRLHHVLLEQLFLAFLSWREAASAVAHLADSSARKLRRRAARGRERSFGNIHRDALRPHNLGVCLPPDAAIYVEEDLISAFRLRNNDCPSTKLDLRFWDPVGICIPLVPKAIG
jgi:hypothetical protein